MWSQKDQLQLQGYTQPCMSHLIKMYRLSPWEVLVLGQGHTLWTLGNGGEGTDSCLSHAYLGHTLIAHFKCIMHFIVCVGSSLGDHHTMPQSKHVTKPGGLFQPTELVQGQGCNGPGLLIGRVSQGTRALSCFPGLTSRSRSVSMLGTAMCTVGR